MSHSPSINDVAKIAGVSMKTVSRVINNEPNVRECTKERVLEAIETLAYTPSVSARILAGNKTYSMVLFCVRPCGDYFSKLHFAILSTCQARSYRLHVSSLEGYYELDDDSLLKQLNSLIKKPYPDGFILIPPFCDRSTIIDFLQERQIPFVRISPKNPDLKNGPAVHFNEEQAAREMVQLMIDQGHRRIAHVKGILTHAGTIARAKGYMSALQENNIEIDPTLILEGNFHFPSGLKAGEKLMALKQRPTAIFASNDEMAAGVSMAIHKAGLNVPADVSVVGFDDDQVAELTWPPLTTIRQPVTEMATTAANWLMDGKPNAALDTTSLSYRLILRDSLGHPPA